MTQPEIEPASPEPLANILTIMPMSSCKVTDKLISKIINNQLDIKLGQFTLEELNVVLGGCPRGIMV